MARYEHLPLFKDIYDFNLYFYKLSRGFPKDFKYGLAQEVSAQTSHIIDQVILANSNKQKDVFLIEAERSLELVKIKIRILKDLGIIGMNSYHYIFTCLIKISQQLLAWKNWSLKNI